MVRPLRRDRAALPHLSEDIPTGHFTGRNMNSQQQRQRNCRNVIKRMFPGIAYSSYVRTAVQSEHDPNKVANLICSDMESGQAYKTKAGNARKRKRGDNEQDGKIKRQNVKPCGSEDPNSGDAFMDCQCCFNSIPMGQVGYCNGIPAHAFCIDCLRRSVESQVERGNYQIMCMSTNKCNAGFSKQERDKFIGESLSTRLARCEQKEQLRLADIRGLVNCPFCDYAEEYPDISVTKEFNCRNPECEITSCRHCNEKAHTPMSCTDAAVARRPNIRHKIEEAMSRALIRHCNKCGTSFIKEEGCNKMTCAIESCRNVQCYVCSQSCDYNHFNNASLVGKGGSCPLYDDVKRRHEREVREAENAARKMLSDGTSVDSAIVLE